MLKPDGKVLWQKKLDSCNIIGCTILASNNGELYVTGTFYGTANLGDTTLIATVSEGFVAKLDSAGNILWIRQATSSQSAFNKMVVNGSGEVFFTGTFSGTEMILGDKQTAGNGNTDAFLAKINTHGHTEWIQNLGTAGDDGIYDMLLVSENAVLLSGYYDGAGKFGGNKLPVKHARTGFLVNFNTATLTAYFYHADTSLFYQNISRKGSAYYFTAAFKDIVNVGLETFENTSPANTLDGLVIKTDDLYDPIWAKHIKGSAPSSLCVNKNECIIIAGAFYNTLETDDKKFVNKGKSDIFIASYSALGNLDWMIQPSGANIDEMHSICADTMNSVFYVLGAVQSGPVKLGNLDISGDISGAPFMAKSKTLLTGISDNDFFSTSASSLDFYPNPAKNILHVRLNKLENTTVSISNVNGQVVYSQNLSTQETDINTQNLTAGLYIITLTSGSGRQSKLLQIKK